MEFNEWMQLIAKRPIQRTGDTDKKSEKMELVDRFLESSPKISPPDSKALSERKDLDSIQENDHLMTETLAKVYLEQKKFEKAIKAYRILSLKYPEKSGFFADRIKAIRILQKNKT